MSTVDIDPEEVDWIKSHAADVAGVFGGEFDGQGARFKNTKTLLQRFDDVIRSMLSNARTLIAAVDDNTFSTLAFAATDFAGARKTFYLSGSRRADDPFSKAEEKYIADNKITLDRTITRFACMSRPQFEMRHWRLNPNVQPPKAPVF